MGDVADILGVAGKKGQDGQSELKKKQKGRKPSKPAGMSREVYSLLGANELPPIAPSRKRQLGLKDKRNVGAISAWRWTVIKSSARTDGLKLYHWQKANVEFPDYPFARFNTQCTVAQYTDEEYKSVLAPTDKEEGWSKADTDRLFQLCRKYDLRWFVIADRFNGSPARTMEQLKYRYYEVARRLSDAAALRKQSSGGAGGTENGAVGALMHSKPFPPSLLPDGNNAWHGYKFNVEHETRRKKQLEALFSRTKAEDEAMNKIKAELKLLEQQIKKVGPKPSRAAQRKAGTAVVNTPVKQISPGPYLRSLTQRVPEVKHGLSKKFLTKMELLLDELKIPQRPLPTYTISKMYDKLRQDIVQLLALRKQAEKAETLLKDLQLQKLRIVDPAAAQSYATALIKERENKEENKGKALKTGPGRGKGKAAGGGAEGGSGGGGGAGGGGAGGGGAGGGGGGSAASFSGEAEAGKPASSFAGPGKQAHVGKGAQATKGPRGKKRKHGSASGTKKRSKTR